MTTRWNWMFARLTLPVLLLASFESCGDPDREYEAGADDGQAGAPDTGSGGSAGSDASEAGAPSSGGSEHGSGGEAGAQDDDGPGGAAGSGGESPDPGRCTLSKPFGAPTFVPAFADNDLSAATLTADGLMIFFWQDSALYSATRDDVDSQFGTALEDELLAPASDWFKQSQSLSDVPAISTDGLILYSQFGGQTVYHIWSATRESKSEAFDAPIQEESLADTIRFSPFISYDGHTLYFRQDDQLYFARKAASGFDIPEPLTSLNSPSIEDTPLVSADEHTIYFSSTRTDGAAKGADDIWMATRSDAEDAFGAPLAVEELNSTASERPVWLSEDGCEIWLSRPIENEGDRLMSSRRPL